MPTWKLNIFVNAIKTRIEREGKNVGDILAEYTKLTKEEKIEIVNSI